MKTLPMLSAALLVGGLASCGSSHATGPQVSSVVVTPSTYTLLAAGATVQFAAQAKDAVGDSVTGEAVTWTSSTPSVATVSSSGLATAVANGSTNITATVAGVSGSATLTVSIQSAACSNPTTISLAVGESQSLPSTNCFILPSGSNGDRYRVTVLHPVGTADEDSPPQDTIWSTLQVTGMGVSGAPAAQPAASPIRSIAGLSSAQLLHDLQVDRATEAVESEKWATIARMPRGAVLPAAPRSTLTRAAAADLPNTLQFDTVTSTCTTSASNTVTAVLVYQNADLAIYQDSLQHTTKPVSQTDAKFMADYYTAYAKAMITAYFGANPDIDNNGKLIVFVSPVVGGNVAGFVWPGDMYAKSECAASNQRDMIYFNADLIRQMDGTQPDWQALPTLAHEAKHVVSLYDRIANGSLHPTWLEEGGAEISGEMSSRLAWADSGGPPVGSQVTINDLQDNITGGIKVKSYDYGVLLRMARTVYYLSSQPNGLDVSPTGADPDESIYGSGWHFLRWLGDGYGNAGSMAEGDSAFFRQVTDSVTPSGTAGLAQITGQSFPTLVNQFIEAVSLVGMTAPAPSHPFSTYDFVTSTNVLQNPPSGVYPWPVTTSGGVITRSFATATYAGPIGAWGIRIHDFVSNGTGTGAQIQVSMSSPGTVVVVRIN